ncbi:AraC family transcriptional regulator [Crenobacter sp. SG2305]|uniref:AraC family transcriptional regulator n=1 Tax=Crenobacter oryzisoli TaxID=3056844 RepID=UPI0025AADB3E|nr:AraC family transcriptional regulator [Crenobacter sp. SG2305]MDN0083599.1 AraC family transcriptional regulator [Crenobacter sp. SG2305]
MIDESDVLTHVLDPLRLNGMFLSQWEVSSPWAIQGKPEPCALIHYMASGSATISMPDQEPVTLAEGDLAMFPRGDTHIVGDSPRTPPRPLEDVLPTRSTGKFSLIHLDGGGEPGRMLCAGLHYEADGVLPLYHLLPSLLVVEAEQISKEPLLAHMLDGLKREISEHHEGRNLVLLRGFELVYLLGLRVALRDPSALGRVASVLRNPGIGHALTAIYENYDYPWTLESLAQSAGMSRSAFAQTFKQLIGEAPARHLMRRRLAEAKRLLSVTTLSQEAIAKKIGYESTVGMHLAFRSLYDTTPGAFRKKHQAKLRRNG